MLSVVEQMPRLSVILFLCSALAIPSWASVETEVPEVTAEGYQLVYELNIPARAAFNGVSKVPYVVDRRTQVRGFDRVAYYLELTEAAGQRWVYVSMDAFTHSIHELAIPHDRDNPVLFQQAVRNMTVLSNDPRIKARLQGAPGWIEMWPTDYAASNAALVPKASDQVFDFGDTWVSNGAGYGSFQIHDLEAQQTLFAWNHWGNAEGSSNDDLGIGPARTGSPDYTFAANAHLYSARKLMILVRPTPYVIEWSAAPKDLQLYPRDLKTDTAKVAIVGKETAGGFDAVVLRVHGRLGGIFNESEQALTYLDGKASFALSYAVPAELRGYDFELFLRRGQELLLAHQAEDVVAGDVLVIQGQSNADAAMYSGSANTYRHPFVRTFGQNSADPWIAQTANDWRMASGDGSNEVPGGVGQWGLVLGNRLASSFRVPIAIMNGAHGGQPISFFQRNKSLPKDQNSNYGRLLRRMQQAGLDRGARATLFYQGESDADDGLVHENGYRALRAAWDLDYPETQMSYIHQVREGCVVSRGSLDLRNRQRRLAEQLPRTGLMCGNGLDAHDGCHYGFVGGYEKIGESFFRMLGRDLYGSGDVLDIDPPNPARAEFTSAAHKEIRIPLRNSGDRVTFDAAAASDFFLEGSTAIVRSGRMDGQSILLTLSRNADGARAVSYNGHSGAGAWVKNGNGVGLVCFSEPIVDRYPLVQILAPRASTETRVGIPLPLGAFATIKNARIRSLELRINGVVLSRVEGQTNLTSNWTPSAPGTYELTARATTDNGLSGTSDPLTLFVSEQALKPAIGDGLQVWLRTPQGVVTDANGRIIQWQDQSGHALHASQAGLGGRPILEEKVFGCLPGVRFVPGQWLANVSGMPTNSYTKLVRYRLAATNLSNHLLSGPDNTPGVHQLLHANSLFPRIAHGTVIATSSIPVVLEQERVAIATYDATSMEAKLYLDGEQVAAGIAVRNNTSVGWVVGGVRNVGQLNGWVGEVMIYDRVLSDTERATLLSSMEGRCRSPFQLWWEDKGFSDGDPATDSDGDGVPLGLEYALGLDPRSADATPPIDRLVQDPINAGRFWFQLDRPRGFAHVDYQVQISLNLQTWENAPAPSILPSPLGQAFERLRWLLPEGDRQFVRLGVSVQ